MLFSAHERRRGFVVTGDDVAVAAAAAVGVTAPWWQPVLTMIPSFAQGVIVTSTVVYVIARAINEIRKFWKDPR